MAKKSFLVIGLGRLGTSLALTLSKMGHDVLAVDRNEEHVSAIADHVTHSMIADASEERVLKQLGVSNFDCVVVAVGDDLRSSILTTVLCKEQGAKRVISKAYDDLHAKLLVKTGADKVIMPERETGVRLAHALANESVLDIIELSQEYSITEMRVPQEWVDKSLQELDVRARYKVSVIAVKRGESMNVAVGAGYTLREGDEIIMLGANDCLQRVEALGAK